MKKLTVFLSILLLSISLFAIETSLTLGYQLKLTNYHVHDPIYISIDLWQDIGDLTLYGNYTNEMSKSTDSWMLSPSQDYYMVGAEYDFDIFVLRAEHMCMHPVVSQSSWSGLQGGYTRFEITLGD